MADNTEFDAPAIRDIGTELQSLMKDHQRAFDDLKAHWPNAGSFPTAVWLERVVGDRRDGLVQHGERLNMTLDQLGSDLREIASELESTDEFNAEDIRGVIDDGRGKNEREVNEYSARTEEEWGNFEEDDEEDAENGDGYDDNTALPGESLPGDEEDSDDEDSEDSDDEDGDEEDSNEEDENSNEDDEDGNEEDDNGSSVNDEWDNPLRYR